MCHRCLGYTRQHSDKAPLSELASPSLPDFGSASVSRLWTCLPTFGIQKGQALVRMFLCKENRVQQSRPCLWSVLESFGVDGEELTHHHAIVWRIPLDCSTSSHIQGAWMNTWCNKCAASYDNTRANWEARVCCVDLTIMRSMRKTSCRRGRIRLFKGKFL